MIAGISGIVTEHSVLHKFLSVLEDDAVVSLELRKVSIVARYWRTVPSIMRAPHSVLRAPVTRDTERGQIS